MDFEVASEVSGGVGAIYLPFFGEEAEEKLVRGHGLECVLGSIGRRLLDIRFGLMALVERTLVLLQHVGA